MKRFSIGTKYEFCPNGNYWTDMSGIFDKEFYLYCDCKKCNGIVYNLKPINVTRKVRKESIDNHKKWLKLEEVRANITFENVDEVAKIINKQENK